MTRSAGWNAVIAIHDSTLGPAIGGVRFAPYPDLDAAVNDCCRLARAMTLKAAIAGLDLGGGWSVIVGDPATARTDARLLAHGRFIATLRGGFIPVNDVGTRQADIVDRSGDIAGLRCRRPVAVHSVATPISPRAVESTMA